MLLNKFILLSEAITNDGGISADYILITVIGLCGLLIVTLAGITFNNINANIKKLGEGFDKFQTDFHQFVQQQSTLNERFEQRTKDL